MTTEDEVRCECEKKVRCADCRTPLCFDHDPFFYDDHAVGPYCKECCSW